MTIAANTIAFWEMQNNAVDAAGVADLVPHGVILYPTSPVCGSKTYMSGPFTTANYFSFAAATLAALQAATALTFEFNIHMPANPTLGIVMRHDGGGEALEISIQTIAADPYSLVFRIYRGGWSTVTVGSILNVGQCYNIACTLSGTTAKIYVDNVLKTSGVIGANMATWSSCVIGTDTSTQFAGYLNEFRCSNIARTGPFPTVDPVAATGDGGALLRRRRRS